MARPDALCPLRPGDRCTLCVPGATGPEDCPTVAMVMADPELRERLRELQAEHRAEQRAQGALRR